MRIYINSTLAPFARHEHPILQDLDEQDSDSGDSPVMQDSPTALALAQASESFAFDWQHVSSPFEASVSPELSGVREHLQALRNDHGSSDVTITPEICKRSSPKVDIQASGSGDCIPEEQYHESPSGEFGALPPGVSGSSAKIGNLRRYSSLNFDLQSSVSVMSLAAAVEDLAGEPMPSPVHLRHARSFLGLSLGSNDESLGGPSWTNKLRRRTPRPETPPVPAPELPKGVRQMGNGIGYTRRAEARRSVLGLASLTPRTCQAMFSGRLPRFGGKRKQKDTDTSDGGGQRDQAADEDDADDADPMDEVMREIYGDDWAGGESPAVLRPSARLQGRGRGGGRVGLGWDDTLTRDGTPPVDASFAGADSTLRLVSPSTPRLGLY